MKIKRFLADDLPSAVAAVRRELGREAVILTTRRVARPGWRRIFRRFDRIEVAAAIEEAALAVHVSRTLQGMRAHPGGAAGDGVTAAPAPEPALRPRPLPAHRPPVPEAATADGAFPTLRPLPSPPAVPAAAAVGAGTEAAEGDAAPGRAGVDIREAGAPDALRRALFADDLAPGNLPAPQAIRIQPGTRRLVAFVGPTGAGKTTTLAKIAAHLHLQQGWRVGLITADTFRVGAVEQLQAYARLLSLPLEVTPTPGALERALERMRSADVVLIDTSGRGHRDLRRMGELFSFLNVAREVGTGGGAARPEAEGLHDARAQPAHGPGGLEVHLVLAAPTRRDEVVAIVDAYRTQIDRCLLTKLDECEAPPEALPVVSAAGLTLSYCSAGQRVPEDLALAWPDRLATGIARPAPAMGLPAPAQPARA